MEREDFVIVTLIALLLVGSHYIVYKLGRHYERKDLTAALISQTEDTYYQGRADGEKECQRNINLNGQF